MTKASAGIGLYEDMIYFVKYFKLEKFLSTGIIAFQAVQTLDEKKEKNNKIHGTKNIYNFHPSQLTTGE